jgi:hypothetical protein
MKTFIELEQIGIVGTYKESNILFIITKEGEVWSYIPAHKKFELSRQL